MWKSQVCDAFYGSGGPSLIDGAMPRDFSNETFEMRFVDLSGDMNSSHDHILLTAYIGK